MFKITAIGLMVLAWLTFAPQSWGACDYSNAQNHGGYGWNASTGQSCPPQSSGTSNNNTSTNSGNYTAPIVGMRIYWQANPSAEGVDRYQIDYKLNNGNWDTFPIAWNTTELIVYLDQFGIDEGDEVCIRLRAGTHQEWSSWSAPEVCVDIPRWNTGTASTGVSVPNGAGVELRTY